tara:strand:- start:1454 stop:2494 length:1041 start_codon:yes stop_codon:yes gene_type:complete
LTIKKRKIGNTGIEVSELGCGTAPIGGWPIPVTDEQADATFNTAWENDIRLFDTAPLYGSGVSEKRLGKFLNTKNRDDYVISTKVGRLIVDTNKSKAAEFFIGSPQDKDSEFNFTYDGVMKSYEESLKRLGLDRIDILHLHDPDDYFDDSKNGGLKAMIKLKDQGAIRAIGCGMNQNEMLYEYAKEGCFDCFLLAGRYTLIDQTSLDKLIPICEKNNISLLLGGVFNSGILIDPSPDSYFDYSKLDKDWFNSALKNKVRTPKSFESADYWLKKAYKIKDACEKFNIQLKQAAVQFSYTHSIVSSSILGMTSPAQVKDNINLYNNKIDKEFWKYLKDNSLVSNKISI